MIEIDIRFLGMKNGNSKEKRERKLFGRDRS